MIRTRGIESIDIAARSYRSGAAMSTKPRSARIQPNSEINIAGTFRAVLVKSDDQQSPQQQQRAHSEPHP